MSAQDLKNSSSEKTSSYEHVKRQENYQQLKNSGYTDKEIFEDLGNANFLAKNYETAVFWYSKLKKISKTGTLGSSYSERYEFALAKSSNTIASSDTQKDWLGQIEADYKVAAEVPDNSRKFKELDFTSREAPQSLNELVQSEIKEVNGLEDLHTGKPEGENIYKSPIALTADGKTAYFTKAVYEKPLYGLFSKKELVHKIFKADNLGDKWGNVQEVALCPKNFSAMHPAVSNDGKRLFFASDMPGTFGEYDIYVSSIKSDGTYGVAKNLGQKVNTKKNDLYPNIVGVNTLFFASEGRKGHGGMDVYMAQVDERKVGLAVNLGDPINSDKDDFSIFLMTEKDMGYVMSNRGRDKDTVHRVAFSYGDKKNVESEEKLSSNFLASLNNDLNVDYSSSVFEDE
tara:strand:+ start:230701 stop:231900 length:1200 start_codon:yes stop_codon:yes gene_type:complete